MRVQIRNDAVIIDGYVNAVARDSRPIQDADGSYVEQIVPGTFERALSDGHEVMLLLNHEAGRLLGSTKSNLELYEDAIGLRAHAIITDADVIEKARKHELRGWSFGFRAKDFDMEALPDGGRRRYVKDMDLEEVSIIDMRKLPCYAGTLIETRAEDDTEIADLLEVRAEYVDEPVDLTSFKARIAALEH